MPDMIQQLFNRPHRFPIMGIVNVTPDSFSDGGLFVSEEGAIEHGVELVDLGAEIVDIGGESTRPGSEGIDAKTELARVLPVIKGVLSKRPKALVSVDTSKPDVAKAALEAGAVMVNDVTAGSTEGMLQLVASAGAAIVLMHMRGKPRTMQKDVMYDDVVGEVSRFLEERSRAALEAGISKDSIVLDPGIGFGKDREGNLALLRGLPRLSSVGYPLVVGTSRKSFLGLITGAPVDQRVSATLASLIPALSVERVVARVHDVEEVLRFRAVIDALELGVCRFF